MIQPVGFTSTAFKPLAEAYLACYGISYICFLVSALAQTKNKKCFGN